mmetsp:Transcript_28655/g.63059  ORF Transcript_28655/g.63059 Transcript_28655/m.63059 type:complete len:209 (-) Transcript_28655:800-1426(-)
MRQPCLVANSTGCVTHAPVHCLGDIVCQCPVPPAIQRPELKRLRDHGQCCRQQGPGVLAAAPHADAGQGQGLGLGLVLPGVRSCRALSCHNPHCCCNCCCWRSFPAQLPLAMLLLALLGPCNLAQLPCTQLHVHLRLDSLNSKDRLALQEGLSAVQSAHTLPGMLRQQVVTDRDQFGTERAQWGVLAVCSGQKLCSGPQQQGIRRCIG